MSKNTFWRKPIRLYWGENYSDKPPEVVEAIIKASSNTINKINLYPGSIYQDAVNQVADKLQVNPDQIIIGHGIEGLIHLTSQTFLDQNKTGGMFDPSFFVFGNNLQRYKNVKYPCHYAKKVDIKDFIKKIAKTDIFFLASPNTATGNYLLIHDEIEQILQKYQGLFVVDECYFGIGSQTVIDLINKYDNLLLFRGLTKVMGLGSLRLAFAVSNKQVINKLKYNLTDIELDPINSFSLNIFLAAFPYFEKLANNTNQFFSEFYKFIQQKFPNDRFIKTITTFYFMDIRRYKIPAYKVMNFLTYNGYIMSEKLLTDNNSISFPEFIQLTPPPKEFWDDFSQVLNKVLNP